MDVQWPLVIFSLLAGSGAAVLAFAGISELTGNAKKARFVVGVIALALMIVGGIASVFHLGKPINFMSAVGNLGSLSGVSLELIFLGLTVVVGIIYILLVRSESSATKPLGAIGLILAVIFAFVTGHSYQIEAQTAWNNFGVSFSYFTSAFTLGGFVYLAVASVVKDDAEELKTPGTLVLVLAILQLISFFAFAALAGLDKADIVVFWLCAIVLGSIVPIVAAGMFAFNGQSATIVYVGLIGALIGGVAIRVFMWMIGSGFINFFQEAANNRGLFILP